MYKNREEAGQKLADELSQYEDEDAVLLAIPRGGVPVAYEIAKRLDIPLDVIIVKKIGHPNNPEYAVGAASVNSSYINPENIRSVTEEYLEEAKNKKQREAKEIYKELRGETSPVDLVGKTAILVDDGVATGSTLKMAITVAKNLGAKKVVIAVPVGSPQAIGMLRQESDDIICPLQPKVFHAIGQFYQDFSQVPTEVAKEMLKENE
jgi:putative phosphoribosyl transferase